MPYDALLFSAKIKAGGKHYLQEEQSGFLKVNYTEIMLPTYSPEEKSLFLSNVLLKSSIKMLFQTLGQMLFFLPERNFQNTLNNGMFER